MEKKEIESTIHFNGGLEVQSASCALHIDASCCDEELDLLIRAIELFKKKRRVNC